MQTLHINTHTPLRFGTPFYNFYLTPSCALGHFFYKNFFIACALLDFKHNQKSTYTNPTH